MKLFVFHRKSVYTNYKQSICSLAALFVLIATIFTIIMPFFITFSLYHDTWPHQKVIFEQPNVQFQYKYIFLAEHTNIQLPSDNIPVINTKIVTCNSYKYLIDVLSEHSECSLIKFWQTDVDFDHKTDQMNFQLTFKPPIGYALNNFNLFLELDAQLRTQCKLRIPAAVLVQQEEMPPNFYSGELKIEGQLKMIQKSGFSCPFFFRHRRTHFFHTLIPENSTEIEDYDLAQIQQKLARNPAYISFVKLSKTWNRHQEDNIILNFVLNIEEISTHYHKTFWQRMGTIWIEYLSIMIIFYFAIDKLKTYMFSEQLIRAWEIIPWKKLY